MSTDQQEEDVTTDELFVGLTRPATICGIHYYAAVAEIVATGIIFLVAGNPFYLLLILPVHGVLYLISASNPRGFNELASWMQTSARCVNSRHWKATSFSPRQTTKWIK